MNEKSELDKFFEGLSSDSPKLEDTPHQEEKPEEVEEKEEISEKEPLKNRKHRRWEEKLSEREHELALKEARLQAIAETKASQHSDVDPRLISLYGDNENGKLAAKITAELLEDAVKKAEERAFHKFQESQEKTVKEQRQYESMIDDKLEDIEEDFNIDLTSNAPAAKKARREFLELVQKVSPKDENGNITGYADFNSTFELYQQSKKQPTNDRSKDLADRTMQKSGTADMSKEEDSKARAYLQSIGINV